MAYTKYSLTPANNTAAPPDGAPEGMLPSAVNDTMRDMMAQIRDVGDGIRDGTYTMTAPKITGGTITGATVTSNTFSSSGATITGGTISGSSIAATQLTGTIASARLPAGSVLQVVTASTTSLGTSTSTSYADTGLTATITPSSASNKIMVFVSQSFQAVGGEAVGYGYQVNAGVQLLRQSTTLITSDDDSGGKYSLGFGTGTAPLTGNIVLFTVWSVNYLDSPATTSAQTYKTQFAKGTSGMSTIYANSSVRSSITLMEIAG